MSSPSPVVANWELVLRLRERREQFGLSVTEIAKRLGFTHNYWSAIENERKIVPVHTLQALFDVLEFGDEDRQQLLALREEAKESGWWSKYSSLFGADVQRLFGLEQGAHQIRGYEAQLVPGLLQTRDYARAVMNSDAVIRPVEVEQRVEARMRRQERLRGEDPLQLTVILAEAALRQQVGGVTVLRDQLEHLLTLTDQHSNNIDIRITPFTATASSLFGAGTLSLLDFQSPRLPRVAWFETVSTWGVVTDANKVRDLTVAFNEALTKTLEKRDAVKLIEKCRKEL